MAIEVVTDEIAAGWSLRISGDTSMESFAALLAGLGTSHYHTRFERDDAGVRWVVVEPQYAGGAAPSAVSIRDILEHGIARLPDLRIVCHYYQQG